MRRNRVEIFSLSLLDVLCCGLGAVLIILLLYMMKVRAAEYESGSLARMFGGLTNTVLAISNAWNGHSLRFGALSQELHTVSASNQYLANHVAQQRSSVTQAFAAGGALLDQARSTVNLQEDQLRRLRLDAAGTATRLAAQNQRLDWLNREIKTAQTARDILGLRVTQTNIVFLIDFSASMAEGSKMADVRGAFKVVFASLARTKTHRATVMTFYGTRRGADLRAAWPGLRLIGENEKEQALAFISSIHSPTGSTPSVAAVRQVLTIPGVEAVVLLSDGEPTSDDGHSIDRDAVAEILAANRARLPIYTVGVGSSMADPHSFGCTFIRDLARAAGADSLSF
jgi:Mg-chelatase subunit ChlD